MKTSFALPQLLHVAVMPRRADSTTIIGEGSITHETPAPPQPAVRRTSRLGHILRVIGEELTVPHARHWWANTLGRVLPEGGAGRLRALLYRRLGVAEMGEGSLVQGAMTFAAARGVRPTVRVGARCFINAHVHIDATAPVTLGNGVSIGHHTMIITASHEIGPACFRAGDLRPAPVTIEDGAWIAANVTILPGVTIGAGAIVAAGAVVTKDVPAGALAGGVPARVLREI